MTLGAGEDLGRSWRHKYVGKGRRDPRRVRGNVGRSESGRGRINS